MAGTRYTENETGIEVTLESAFQWGVHPPQWFVVSFPSGARYITPLDVVNRHFTIVSPQNIDLGFVMMGGLDRPTDKQREAEKADYGNSCPDP